MEPNRLTIRLEIAPEGPGLRGVAVREGAEPRPFQGRLGLISAVDALLDATPASALLATEEPA